MQDYKTGHMIGTTPRYLTYAQLLAVPVGAAAVSWVYPLLRDTYGIGGENGLQSPISQKWAGFAKLLSAGLSALPPGALEALVIGVVLGVVLHRARGHRACKKWMPSPTGIGIGMLVPASAIVSDVPRRPWPARCGARPTRKRAERTWCRSPRASSPARRSSR